ncbi:MAG: hydrolase [Methylibium sp. NZG]|nr:MAG: hydrolase [Methylibium sp. NZG]
MNLVLFDLDHTLIPFDSGMAWTQFLVAQGALSLEAEAQYLAFCHQYVAGTLDIHAMHRASVAPLRRFTRAQLADWSHRFEAEMAPRIPASMRALVGRHQRGGDLCAIVTATTRLVAVPFGRLFGVADVVATEAATEAATERTDDAAATAAATATATSANTPGTAPAAGLAWPQFTGEIAGEPCFREHKLTHVARWLARRGMRLQSFEASWFYSDSASDLPLLQAVTHPVAVNPDARLRAHAASVGWRVLEARD